MRESAVVEGLALRTESISPAVAKVIVEGTVERADAPALKRCIEDAAGAGTTLVVVDLWGCDFVDPVALAVLLAARLRLGHGGGPALVLAHGDVGRALSDAGIEGDVRVLAARACPAV